ncbi:hypothetical protein [Kribbella pittospori]|uniref:hypothetical protein n=1 Tax=Kribbella pittospori TaxID=722689 RepID=UPI001EDF3FD3|nr:hypothetical protein [Kribbella pittospori]
MTRSILVGGEMLGWSDLHPVDALSAAGGAAAGALLAAALRPGDSVLVAGPHKLSLITDIASGVASVDVLVRSAPDAEEIAGLLDGTKGQVICGSLDRLTSDDVYDVVVALDGLDRLVGPDTANLTWSGALARLQTRLAPSGRLLLGAANPFGVERFLQPPISAALPRNEDWARDLDDTAPTGRTSLVSTLEAAGLDISRTYAVFPSLVEADVALASVDHLGAVTAARAIAKRNSGPTLMDPYRLVVDAAAAGLAVELAPAWYVVSGDLPDVLPATAVPAGAGVLLEEHLLAALKVDDQAVVRRTITEYVNWLVAQDHPTAAIAAPDNVILDGTSYRLFGDGDPVDAHGEALVVAHLARFARRSLEGGSRQPWPAGGDVRELTARLGSMAGITVTGELLPAPELVRPLGSAEQLATVARLAEELAEANARAILFEGLLSGIRRSRPYRVGHAVLNPARVIVRRARRMLRKVVR